MRKINRVTKFLREYSKLLKIYLLVILAAMVLIPGSAEALWYIGDRLPWGTQGDITYHDGSSWVDLDVGAEGKMLRSTGTAPEWSDNVSGLVSGFTSGEVIYGDTDDSFASSSNLTFDGNTLSADNLSVHSYSPFAIFTSGYVIGSDVNAITRGFGNLLNWLGLNVEVCNGTSDEVEYQAAVDGLGVGLTRHKWVRAIGTFNFSGNVTINSHYTCLDNTEARFELASENVGCMFTTGTPIYQNLKINGGSYDGNRDSYSTNTTCFRICSAYSIYSDMFITKFVGDGFTLAEGGTGSVIDNFVDDIRVSYCGGTGVVVGSTALGGSSTVSDNYLEDVVSWYHDGDGVVINASATYTYQLNAYGNGRNGVTQYKSYCRHVSPTTDGNGFNGWRLYKLGGAHVTIISGRSINNSDSGTGLYSAYHFDGDGTWSTFSGDLIACWGSDWAGSPTQKQGVEITYGTSSSYINVDGGWYTGNTDAPFDSLFYAAGYPRCKVRNIGSPNTEVSGTATISSGDISVVIDGMALPNAPINIFLTGTHAEVRDCIISGTPTSDNFTIEAAANVTANRDIYYTAKVSR